MKPLFFISIFLLFLQGFSQNDGSTSFKTSSIQLPEIEKIEEIEIGIRGKVLIDCSAKAGVEIGAQESLANLLDVHMEAKRLYISTKEGEELEGKITIKIGAPNLRYVQLNSEGEIFILNLEQEEISTMAIQGQISLRGKVQRFNANGEIGLTDARQLEAKIVQLNYWDHGQVLLGSPETVLGKTRKATIITYENNPKKNLHKYAEKGFNKSPTDSRPKTTSGTQKLKNPDARFINFYIKNNSFNRIQCYVKGPKPDGSTFSYGFPMNPGQRRKKYWSIGTKVYRVNHMGMRKLLLEISSEDEGQVVKMYEKEGEE